jgi:hypothetical protein
LEPQLFKLGFFFLYLKPTGLPPLKLKCRLCFARSAKASGLFVFLRERWQRKSAVEQSETAIATDSATELNINCFFTANYLNEGMPKERNFSIT